MEVQVRNQMCIAVTVRIKHYLTCVILVHVMSDCAHVEIIHSTSEFISNDALLTLQSIWEVIN